MVMHTLALHLKEIQGKSLLLAHSGGVDSCVLAHVLLQNKMPFSVAHCNFQLRAKASNHDSEFVKKWCAAHKIPFHSHSFDTELYKEKFKKGTQEAARELRYQWFNHLMEMEGFEVLLTAHHLNDQLETFLLNATRGTGISGLLGIPQTQKIIRPLASISKKEILSYASHHNIQWREDASNQTNVYLRNQIRHRVVAPLEEFKPEALENFKVTLKHLSEAEKFIGIQLDSLKSVIFKKQHDTFSIAIQELTKLNPLNFCLHHWFAPLGFDAKEVQKLLHALPGKQLFSTSHRLIRDRDYLLLTPLSEENLEEFPFDLEQPNHKLPIALEWNDVDVPVRDQWEANEAFLDKDLLKTPLSIRKYKEGDYFCPTGMKGKKLLIKFFKDEKYSLLEKERQWLLCSKDKIVWVLGRRCDRRFIANARTENKLLMRLSE